MTNRELAAQLRQFADLIEIKGENAFRVNAFRRAADTVADLEEPIESLVTAGTLTSVPGIGAGIAAALQEMVESGRFTAMDEVLGEVPATLLTLLEIPGVGPKSVGRLYRELGITNLVQLEAAATAQQIRTLKGFGAKQEARIREGIAFLNRRTHRISIGIALPAAEQLSETLWSQLGVAVQVAGSVRRMCETVGNIDLVAATLDKTAVVEAMGTISGVEDMSVSDEAIVSATLENGISVRIALTAPDQLGTTLLCWTGSKRHVEQLQASTDNALPAAEDESDVYASLGLQIVPPELREGGDELALARARAIPDLIELGDLRGDLHLHSEWSDGRGTIEELAQTARVLGYEYLSIADHSGGLAIARGLDKERLGQQRKEIDRVNELVPEVRLLRSSEVEVKLDGSLDFPDEVLAELDIVVASLHTGLRLSVDEMTRRITRVLQNPHVDIVAHPTGRIVERRQGAEYDWDTVFRVATETGTALEINANPARLDLNDDLARSAREAGVKIVINSDAHDVPSLYLMRYGIGVARRAGIQNHDVVNTRSLGDLMAWLGR